MHDSKRRRSFVFGSVIFLVLAAAAGWAQPAVCSTPGFPSQLVCFSADTPAVAQEVNANFKTVFDGTVPVGTIVAWHKGLGSVPQALPSSWAECNGQTVADATSPLNGRSLPNLNGEARFLRGGTTSGVLQSDTFQEHRHELNTGEAIHLLRYQHPTGNRELYSAAQAGLTGVGSGYYDDYVTVSPAIGTPTQGSGGTIRTGSETRPANMSVVWIMRIK